MTGTPQPAVEPVLADLRDRWYVFRHPDGDGPDTVAADGEAPRAFTDAPLAVEPLGEVTPLSVVARLATNARAGRSTLFVVDGETAGPLQELLEPPFLCRAASDGCRTFHTIPDRILLTDDTYAAVRVDGDPGWREEPADSPLPTAETTAPGTETDEADPRLLLEADGEIQAVLDSVDALTCPGPDPGAFPYRYTRGDDRRFHVFDRDGKVGQYSGPAAMKANAYRPVPLPLVPDHHLRENRHRAEAWGIAVVDDGSVSYHTSAD